MRKYCLLAVLLLFFIPSFSQSVYIADNLWNELKSNKNDQEKLRVVVLMQEQVNLELLQINFQLNNTPIAERQKSVMRLLQNQAAKSQKDVLDFINNYHQKQGEQIYQIQSFWIVNMMVMEIPVSLIWQLAQRNDIEWMDLDSNWITKPVKPYDSYAGENRSVGGSEPGLSTIKANEMWKKGYTGKNRISYSIDTGVWPDHPALKSRFLANFFPMQQCWFPYDSELPADKTGSHGTHTLGITLGLEEATNDTVGVAFNAYWICSDPVATSMATVKPLSDFMFAYEWALNPDGDTSTVWDIPDAINNSWGYEIATDTLLCDSYVSQMFLAVEAAGIANVFSAGNEGPLPMTIGIPHHLNTNIVNSFTVGALDGNQLPYPIAGFSSRGPSICGGTGSLLIKPEVSAPGVNVRSSVNSSGYDYFSGTSMAGPHVTGAVLLLKEAFPYLAGSEILKALYFTATDLGDPGEDNTYGMGLINLTAAFNYLSSLFTPVPPDSNVYDAEITSVVYPDGIYYCDSVLIPQVILHNNGDSSLVAGTFKFRINNGNEITYAWSGNLASGLSETVTLPAISLNNDYNSELSVWFLSDTSFHENSFINNHCMMRFHYRPKAGLPFTEDFENGIKNPNWHINNPNYNVTWDTMPAGGMPFSAYAVVMRFQASLPSNQTDDLISPSFDFTGLDSVFLRFDVAYQNRHPTLTDSLIISVSTDCGATFQNTIYRKGGKQLETYDTLTIDFVPWRNDQWRTEYIDISAFAGEPEVLIRFTGYNKRGNNLFLDNIKIYSGTEPAGISNINWDEWKIWPNPANESINIQPESATNTHIELNIIDISGKVCLKSDIPEGFMGIKEIDIATLPESIYLLKISDDKKTHSYRFIKVK